MSDSSFVLRLSGATVVKVGPDGVEQFMEMLTVAIAHDAEISMFSGYPYSLSPIDWGISKMIMPPMDFVESDMPVMLVADHPERREIELLTDLLEQASSFGSTLAPRFLDLPAPRFERKAGHRAVVEDRSPPWMQAVQQKAGRPRPGGRRHIRRRF